MKRAPEGSGQAMRAILSQNLSRILIGSRMTELASSSDKSGQVMYQLKNNLNT